VQSLKQKLKQLPSAILNYLAMRFQEQFLYTDPPYLALGTYTQKKEQVPYKIKEISYNRVNDEQGQPATKAAVKPGDTLFSAQRNASVMQLCPGFAHRAPLNPPQNRSAIRR